MECSGECSVVCVGGCVCVCVCGCVCGCVCVECVSVYDNYMEIMSLQIL